MDDRKQLELDKALTLGENKYYTGIDPLLCEDSLTPGSAPADGLYEHWIQIYQPEIIIEVGSFLGYSAIKMAKEVQRLGLSTKIICVDTWLGSPEHYDMFKAGDNRLGYINGYPTLYRKFISNVIVHGVKDIIYPFPYPSTIGGKILTKIFHKLDVKADFIFIDGSHEFSDVFLDCFNYFPLLKDKGALWGDDFGWEGVNQAATRFATENNLRVSVLENKVHWNIQKL